jgi:hypothetical protein
MSKRELTEEEWREKYLLTESVYKLWLDELRKKNKRTEQGTEN